MIRYIQTLIHRWQQQHRARLVYYELAAAGYTAEDLVRLARLRAAIGPTLMDTPDEPEVVDPTRPPLETVLRQWEIAPVFPSHPGIADFPEIRMMAE
jgi:hypothetical protein